MQRNEYLALRDRYKPVNVKLVVVAESPPDFEKYFYKPGRPSEPLFAELMKQAGLDPSAFASKEDGLFEFAQRGWFLVDATYQPVNHRSVSLAAKTKIINRDYPLLLADLLQLMPDRTAPLVLIKASVCKILEPRLVQDGFNVLNRGVHPPFPRSPFHHITFRERFRTILEKSVFRPTSGNGNE